MGRQHCVIAALMDQTGMTELTWNFPTIAGVIKRSLRTDIPIDTLQQLIKIRSKLKTDEMITVGFTPPEYLLRLNELGYNVLDVDLVQSTVRKILEHPEEVLQNRDPDANVDDSDCWKIE
jgi:anionic cell wall polymer biosynthesis LytR-Cps2A-Psr (LCP) family protein